MSPSATDNASWYDDPLRILDELQRDHRHTTTTPTLRGYQDIRLLQRGGQGTVYTAVQQSTRRRVAVKVLFENAVAQVPGRRRFEREIDVVAALEHPGIVRVYDGGVTPEGLMFFVMEYVEGQSLDESIRDGHVPALRDRLQLFAKICEAVGHAHQHGVIHRDLKPSNIRIDRHGQPRILDFGIAKAAGPAAGGAVTVTGQFLGTLAYASPEQIQGDPAKVDVRSDVYALGILLHELLLGERPYSCSGGIADAVRAIAEDTHTPPSKRRRRQAGAVPEGGLDDELDTIVLTALAKDPERRYQSAAALRQDVLNYLAGLPLDAKRDSTAYLLRKMLSRHKLAVAAGVAVVILGLAGTVVLLFMYHRSVTETAKANQIKIFLEDTLSSVEPLGEGREVTVHEALDEAVHWVEITLADQPEIEAALRHTIGNSYRSLGLLQAAEDQLQRALDIRLQLWGRRHLDVAASLNSLALLRRDQQQLDSAEQLARESLGLRQQLLGEDHLETTNNLLNLGRILAAQGRTRDARALYEQALDLRVRWLGHDHQDVAMCLYGLGELLAADGRLERAIALHREALDLRRAVLHSRHPDLARSALALGRLLNEHGRPEAAEPLIVEGRRIRQAVLPVEHWRIAEATALLGDCLTRLQRFDEARALLPAACDQITAARGTDSAEARHCRQQLRRLSGARQSIEPPGPAPWNPD